MKFGKELCAQMVQEWQGAYMEYNILKTLLKDVERTNGPPPVGASPGASFKRRVSLHRAFSGLTTQYSNLKHMSHEEDVILVSEVEEEEDGSSSGKHYQTMFLMSCEQGGDYAVVFFSRLDDEFNKVNKFYKKKVDEVMIEAKELNKQMDALIALRIRVNELAGESSMSGSSCIGGGRTARARMGTIEEVEMSKEEFTKGRSIPQNETNAKTGTTVTGRFNSCALDVLNHVKVNMEPQTPIEAFRIMLASSKEGLSYSRDELRRVEDQMRHAFTEFYHKLRLLKSYCFMNQLAFSKILKKYDKITSRNASKVYLEMIDSSYIGNSDELNKLIERVEATFIKHFANGNRKKGLKTIKPEARKEKHRTTFFLGLFTGCSIALVVAVIVITHARNLLQSEGRGQYMENIFPLYSLFGFVVLHMVMYGANIYFWRRYRVNYPFIFGFKTGSGLGYRQVFLLSSGVAVLALAAVLSNLDMDMDPRTRSFSALTELVPLGLVIMVLAIILCPLNIIYRSSRFFLLKSVYHGICAPLYKVTLPDFFLADQLTSQVQALRSGLFYICYYGWGDYEKRTNKCKQSDVFNTFYIIVAVIPYWIRFLQCIRRLVEEKDNMQGVNGLKYFSTIVAVILRTCNDMKGGLFWRVMAGISSAFATVFSMYWDIVFDWGLLQKGSRNRWLRDKLLVPHKSVYFVAMAVNLILRFAWTQSVLGFYNVPFLHKKALTAIVACLEIIRRGLWNFFRLENEHLNNVGKYRAFKTVPLPFNYNDAKLV